MTAVKAQKHHITRRHVSEKEQEMEKTREFYKNRKTPVTRAET